MRTLRLSPRQVDVVSWALDAMRDYVLEDDCDYAEADLPELVGAELRPGSPDALDDLLYRLEVQLASMKPHDFPDELPDWRADFRSATAISGRIRDEWGVR
jgi:hypothetical protein